MKSLLPLTSTPQPLYLGRAILEDPPSPFWPLSQVAIFLLNFSGKKMDPTKIPTETQEAIALVKWVNLNQHLRDFFIHIPNEGLRSVQCGQTLVRMGLKRGVSDYFLAYPVAPYHGLWLELKRRKGANATDSQVDWIAKMQSVGYAAVIVYGWIEAKDVIQGYLKGQVWTLTR